MAGAQKGVNRICICFRKNKVCSRREPTCFKLICKWGISSYGNISQNLGLYLGQFAFCVRLLEFLLENAAVWLWRVPCGDKSKSVICNLLCWRFISGCCLTIGFHMQSLNCCMKVHLSPIPRSIEAFKPAFLKTSPADVLCSWTWLAKPWTCLPSGHSERPAWVAAGFCLLRRVSVLWGVWEFVVVLMMLLTSSFMSGKYWCSMCLLVAKQLAAALWKSIKQYNL